MEIPKSINIKVYYDKEIQKITKNESEFMVLSDGVTFIFLLQSIFMAYPEIEKKYPPGNLGILLNSKPLVQNSALFDGDEIKFLLA